MRNPNFDKLKVQHEQHYITENNITCCVDGCTEYISLYEGPGSETLCRDHQLNLTDYGGLGKQARTHTFHRDWICDECGYDVREDPLFKSIKNEKDRSTAMRSYMHGDHLIRQADGGDNSKENIRALCSKCHVIKTAIEHDWRKPEPIDK